MKKSLLFLIAAAVVFIIGTLCIKLHQRLGFENEITSFPRYHQPCDSTLIAVVGDSWAHIANERGFSDSLQQLTGMKVISGGLCGYKSKDIYRELTRGELHSLLSNHPKYVIVFAGMNDIHGQYGATYYAHHLQLIAEYIAQMQSVPIIVGLPTWDVSETHRTYPLIRQLAYRCLSMITNGTFSINNTSKYHQAFKECVFPPETILVDIAHFSSDDSELWKDNMHLSNVGYAKLAKEIHKQLCLQRNVVLP
ncbi:MAG: SGNH/GDSL hydrolase family protein [Bacteroidaceae bacterium]|nr:SGNH/GDSL hydrolase family protein [Bacteroidaceae bacterium]